MNAPHPQAQVDPKLQVLLDVARTLAAHLQLPALLDAVLDTITGALEPAEIGLILFWDPSAELFRPQAASGPALHDRQAALGLNLSRGESITGKVFAENRPRLLATAEQVAGEKHTLQPAKRAMMARAYGSERLPVCAVAVPLTKEEHRYGVLVLETMTGPACFTPADLPFIQVLADLIALEIDRARLDAETAQSQQAHEADRLRSEIMAALSHELRTPLASIKGYATALALEEVVWPEEKRLEFLHLIEEETDNLERMVSEIMDASLIDIGQLEIELQPVRVPRLAADVVQEMQLQSEQHRFVLDFPADFPLIDADPGRLRQVLRNLLDNAIKYSPDGGLIVARGEVRPTDVVVSVADQGVGISAEDLIPLFDKYFRVKAPTGYHVPGTGLGLPVARAIVETHGGRIWAESTIGQGTTLYFSLPTDQPEQKRGVSPSPNER